MRKISKIEPKAAAIKPKKKVAAYARVSRDTERLMHSASAQVSYYSSMIQKNPDWQYAGVYADYGISGTKVAKRDEFCRMLQDCEDGKIDIILTKSISRFARNTVDLLETVRHLKSLGVEVRFEKEHINSMSGDGELMLSILASFAQEESRSISDNCKWGIRKRFQSGEIGMANKHLSGYQYDEKQKCYMVVPEEAEMVRWMFRMYLDGTTLRNIAKNMNDAGYRTINDKLFNKSTVRQLLHNDIYAGIIRRQKSYIPDPILGKKVINDGVLPQYIIEDAHEAIIDKETYELVLAEHRRRESMQNPTYPFTRKIKCGICGRSYARVAAAKETQCARWLCRSKKEKGMNCGSQSFTEPKLQEICAELMGTDGFDEQKFNEAVNSITVLDGGDVQMQFKGGETKTWKMPPKPVKVKKEKVLKIPHNLLDGKIFCGMCGKRYGRAISTTKDGGHLYWSCRAKHQHGITCDSVNYADTEIREIFCKVMQKKSFDDEFFTATVEKMVVQKTGSIDFYLKDGMVKHFETLKLRVNVHQSTSTDEFIGKIRCGICGNVLRRYCSYGKYHYWYCPGKSKVRTECNAQDLADCNLRTVSAYIMGTEEFDASEFAKQVKAIIVQKDGSLKYYFYDGSEKTWQKM